MATDITAQAGKGSGPRTDFRAQNFRENYDAIDWGRGPKAVSWKLYQFEEASKAYTKHVLTSPKK